MWISKVCVLKFSKTSQTSRSLQLICDNKRKQSHFAINYLRRTNSGFLCFEILKFGVFICFLRRGYFNLIDIRYKNITKHFNFGNLQTKNSKKPNLYNKFHVLSLSWLIFLNLSLIHIWRCRRSTLCRSRWSPYH